MHDVVNHTHKRYCSLLRYSDAVMGYTHSKYTTEFDLSLFVYKTPVVVQKVGSLHGDAGSHLNNVPLLQPVVQCW